MAFRRRFIPRARRGVKRKLRWTAFTGLSDVPGTMVPSNPAIRINDPLLTSEGITPTGTEPLEAEGATLTRIRGSLIFNFDLQNQDEPNFGSPLLKWHLGILVADANPTFGLGSFNPFDDPDILAQQDWLWLYQWQCHMHSEVAESAVNSFREQLHSVDVDVKAQRKLQPGRTHVWLIHHVEGIGLGEGEPQAILEVTCRVLLRSLVRI